MISQTFCEVRVFFSITQFMKKKGSELQLALVRLDHINKDDCAMQAKQTPHIEIATIQ